MALKEEELKELIDPSIDIEKKSKLSYDGSNLVVRIPKVIQNELELVKGQYITWKLNLRENKVEVYVHGKN